MQYINTNDLTIFNTLGEVRKAIVPNSIPRIPTRTELNNVGVDYLYDYVPHDSILTIPVRGEPYYNEEQNRWQYSYTFAPKNQTEESANTFVQDELKKAKESTRTRLEKTMQEKVDELTSKAPFAEIVSYDKQEAEARAYLIDNTTNTPYLEILAQSRGLNETIEELAIKVVANADQYCVAHAMLLGEYQKLIRTLNGMEADTSTIDQVLKDIDSLQFAG